MYQYTNSTTPPRVRLEYEGVVHSSAAEDAMELPSIVELNFRPLLEKRRHQQDLNLRSQRETDNQTEFESVALTTRP